MGAGDDPEVRGTGERRTTWRGLIGWVERLAYAAGDTEETRRRKVQFISANILVVPAGLIWGALYFAYGEPAVCVFPLAYAVLTFVNLSLFVRVRRYELFRYVQQCMILVLPFELQIGLGGFVGSGTVIFWSFVAVLMAVLFGDIREARWWFAAYAAAVVAAAWLQPLLVIRNHLPNRLVLTFFVLNLVVVSSVVFAVLYSFVTDRRKLRELEVAFLNQDIMLRNSEKLATLGTLAAGVAHELNNPAAATRRAADQLRSAFARLEQAHLRLGSANLTDEERELLRSLEQRARERAAGPVNLDPLARSDQETAVEEWLEVQGVADPGDLAPSLVGLGLDRQELSRVFAAFDNETSSVVLTWAASAFPVYSLLYEINQGSARISEIVGALRSYSYLGQAPVQMVDLREGLDDTLVILRHKLKAGINVHREYGADVPKVPAYGSELNQVWTNLLDNAADAMGGKGEITIRTRRQQNWAVVEIEDNGPGIPQEIQPRIFDPFFTTKAPGKGTGLGLSTSQAIVTQKHKGELHLESRPGLTRFVVKLPIDPPPVAAPAPGRTGATTPSA